MEAIIEVDGLKIRIKRKNIKNLYVRIKNTGEVIVSAPIKMSDRVIREFITIRKDWIDEKLAGLEDKIIISKISLANGDTLDYFGDKIKINKKHVDKNPLYIELDKGNLNLYVKRNTTKQKQIEMIKTWYREQLIIRMKILISKWEKILNKKVYEYRTKQMKTRWGTCNIDKKRIWINLELAKLPEEYLEYVIVHEMMHLFESGHGKRFQRLMDKYYPDWKIRDNQLNKYIIEK